MKRNIDICRKCAHYGEEKVVTTWCNRSTGESGRKVVAYSQCNIDGKVARPSDLYDEVDLDENCVMKAEYCIEEWNDEKKD